MGVGFKRGGMVSYVTVSVSAQTGGTASGSGRFMKGRTVTVVAAPGSSYIFSGWYNGNTLVSTAATYTFIVTEDITLQARFIAQYTVSVSAGAGGTASGSKTANVGSPVTVTASPSTYYTFDGWYEGNTKVSSSASYTFTLTRNVTLQARFRIIQYTVSVSAETGGTASGGSAVNAGSSITVTATPAAYHNFDGWYVGGTKVSGSSTYTFTVTGNISLTAKFIAVRPSGGVSGQGEFCVPLYAPIPNEGVHFYIPLINGYAPNSVTIHGTTYCKTQYPANPDAMGGYYIRNPDFGPESITIPTDNSLVLWNRTPAATAHKFRAIIEGEYLRLTLKDYPGAGDSYNPKIVCFAPLVYTLNY